MSELYLAHHGIKGQKWGVRNGPPYPLNSKGKSRSKTIQEYIKQGKIKTDKLANYTVGSLTTMTTANGEKFTSGLIHGHDFDWQEVVYADGEWKPAAKFAKEMIEETGGYGRYGFVDGDPIFERSVNHGRVDDCLLEACNPTFGAPGTTQNCAKCSATLELATRGMYFKAGRQTYPSSVDAESYWFKGAKRMEMETDIAEDAIKSFGKKTSGTISIQYPEGAGGHAMHWTVDDEGTFEIQDGQNGRRFSSLKSMMDTYGADKSVGVDVFRLDNCEPDWDHMASDSVVRDHESDSNNPYVKVRNRFSGDVVDRW